MTAPRGDAPVRHLTVADLAEREGVSVHQVYRWNSEGTGPVRLQSGKRGPCRYRLADVIAWERTRERGGSLVPA